MTELDSVFAKGAAALQANAHRPEMKKGGETVIQNGRHPLIDKERVVPVTVKVGDTYRALIVTGPNTGGKTVTLKLTGLTSLMAQSGLFIYASEGSKLNVYDEVFADIGDEQSIEQSLSTFSSHMKNIINILKCADEHSLVLLDELGAGTDPQEGAALAAAILDELKQKNVTVVATTHYSEIKTLAVSDRYFENAGMEFDIASLSPTYRLFLGMSGKSNAFLISERLGIAKDIIEKAKCNMSAERLKADELIAEAERTLTAAKDEKQRTEEMLQTAEKKLHHSAAGALLADEQAQKIMDKAKDEAKKLVDDAKRETEAIIGELKRSSAPYREITDISAKAREGLKKQSAKTEKVRTTEKGTANIDEVIPGAEVEVLTNQGSSYGIIVPPTRRETFRYARA